MLNNQLEVAHMEAYKCANTTNHFSNDKDAVSWDDNYLTT